MANRYSKREWERQFGDILYKLEQGGSLNHYNIVSQLKKELESRKMVFPKKFDLGGFLTKYENGGNPDDEWIKKILEFEANYGRADGTGLPNFGYNNYNVKDPSRKDPTGDMELALKYFKEDYLPQVSEFPLGLREQLGDYKYNTGRSIPHLLLYASGNATLDEINSDDPNLNAELDKRWQENSANISQNYNNPEFWKKVTASKHDIGKTKGSYDDPQNPGKKLKYTLDNPNPIYKTSWSKRFDLWQPSSSDTGGNMVTPETTPETNQQTTPDTQEQSITENPTLTGENALISPSVQKLDEVTVSDSRLGPTLPKTQPKPLEIPKPKLPKINIQDVSATDVVDNNTEKGVENVTKSVTSNSKFGLDTLLKAAPYAKAIGQIVNFGLEGLRKDAYEMNPMERDYNPYTMKMGGMLDKYTDGGTMPGSKTFIGPTHEEGGIPVNENGEVNASTAIAEVENDEFMHKFSFIPRKGNYIYSKALGTADMAEKLVDKYSKKKGKHANPLTDNLSKQQMEFELKQLADLNDMRKAMEAQLKMAEAQGDMEMQDGQMRLGGILGKVLKQYVDGGDLDADPIPSKVDFVPVKLFETPTFNLNPKPEELNINKAILEGLGEKDTTGGKYNSIIENYGKLGVTYYDDKGKPIPKKKGSIKKGSIESDILKGLGPSFEEDEEKVKKVRKSLADDNRTADTLRAAVMIGDTLQALRPAEKESPILGEYAKARGELDSMSVDLTAARNAAVATFNEASEQIRNTSPSIQSYITRKMGMASNQMEALSQIAMKEREMRNAIAQAKGSFEQAVAADVANRRYQNRVDNLQNKAAKEAYLQRIGDNMLGIAKDLDVRNVNKLTTKEGLQLLAAFGENFTFVENEETGEKSIEFRKTVNKKKE